MNAEEKLAEIETKLNTALRRLSRLEAKDRLRKERKPAANKPAGRSASLKDAMHQRIDKKFGMKKAAA